MAMKILRYENRKCDPVSFDASTPEKENAAFLKIKAAREGLGLE
jgi:hypothetical protein